MALILRLGGWAIFITGMVIFLLNQEGADTTCRITGLVVAGVGVLCTMSCNLIASYAELRRRKERIQPAEPLTPESAERAREIIRKRASRPAPGPQSSPPSEPSTPD